MTNSDNHITLTGRVSAVPETVFLPSGDQLTNFRLIVDRSRAAKRRSKQKVDTFECVALTAAMRRTVGRLEPSTRVTVTGELRRRWSRGSYGLMSHTSIEVGTCEVVESARVASTP